MTNAVATQPADGPATVAHNFESAAQRAVKFVNAFTIETAEDYANAAEELRGIKDRGKALEAERVKITQPLNAALNAANLLFKGPASTLTFVESLWKTKMLAYQSKQAAIAEAARARSEQEAKAERKRLEDEAERLRAIGNAEAADAAAAEAEVVVAQPLALDKPKAAGISTARTLEHKVVDKGAFITFVSTRLIQGDKTMLDYLNVDDVRLRKAVQTHGKALNWPGLEVVDKSTIRVR